MTAPRHAYWLEQAEADVPAGDRWLSAGERLHLCSLRFEKRRGDWRLGRWTAKRAAASWLNLGVESRTLEDMEIRTMPSGAPQLFLFQQKADVSLSLSHRDRRAFCVVGFSGVGLGCDLELVEAREPSFVSDFFTAREQQLLLRAAADERAGLVTVMWSAKESALKALRVGLRLSTTSLDVSFTDGPCQFKEYFDQDGRAIWSPLSLRRADGQILRGRWRCAKNVVRTVVFNPLQTGSAG